MRTVRQAAEEIVGATPVLGAERIPLRDALGRVLAEDVIAPLDLPPWNNASMDGYALQAADVETASRASPATFRVIGTIGAGASAGRFVGSGEAYRIMTGAPVPPGADSVIRVEDTDAGVERVRVFDPRDARRNIRPRGEDLALGALAVSKGTRLGAGHVGVLASIGRSAIAVHRRPRVAILATGDELVDLDQFEAVLRGQRIVTSNSYTIEAAVRSAGGVPIPLGIARDDPEAIAARILGAPQHDLLVTSGGVSVGEYDHTRRVIERVGGELRFWKVKIRPGAPLAFGRLRGALWLGLPGNSVSTMVTFELFARPMILRMQGMTRVFPQALRVRTGERLTVAPALMHFLRAVVTPAADGVFEARLTGSQSSGLLTSMARANALLVVAEDRTVVEAGEFLHALLLGEDALLAEQISF